MTVALATGARGIGEATALGLARQASMLLSTTATSKHAPTGWLNGSDRRGRATAVRADLTDQAVVESMLAEPRPNRPARPADEAGATQPQEGFSG